MSFPKGFLWGGAVAANQAEGARNAGGKGWSVADVATYKPDTDVKDYKAHVMISSDAIKKAMEDTDETFYPKRRGIDFYHHYKEDLASTCSVCPLHGHVFSPRERKRSPMRKALLIMKMYSRK